MSPPRTDGKSRKLNLTGTRFRWLRFKAAIWNYLHVWRFGVCPRCRLFKTTIETRRQLTQYVHEPSNFARHCAECQEDSDEHWREMWREYHNSVL